MTDRLFADAHNAYRAGRPLPLYDLGNGYRAEPDGVIRAIRGLMSTDGWRVFLQVRYHRQRGFRLAKRGDLSGARASIRRAVGIADRAEVPAIVGHVIDTFLYGNASYVAFRSGEMDAAQAGARRALDAAVALCGLDGFELMAGRRVHLLNNYLRVVAAAGEAGTVVAATAEALAFLEGDAVARPFGPEPSLTVGVPEAEAQRFVGRQLVDELPGLFARAEHVAPLAEAFRPYVEAETPAPLPRVREWAAVQTAIAADDPAQALARAAEVLALGRGPFPLLWHGCVADVCRYAEASGSAVAVRTRAALLGDEAVFEAYPAAYRRKVEALYQASAAPVRAAA